MTVGIPIKIVGGTTRQLDATDNVSANGIEPRSGTVLTLGGAGATQINANGAALTTVAIGGVATTSLDLGVGYTGAAQTINVGTSAATGSLIFLGNAATEVRIPGTLTVTTTAVFDGATEIGTSPGTDGDTLTVYAMTTFTAGRVTGNIDFLKETAHRISIVDSTTAATAGADLTIRAGGGATTGDGGNLILTGGTSGSGTPGGITATTTATADSTTATDKPVLKLTQAAGTAVVFVGTTDPSASGPLDNGATPGEGSLYLRTTGSAGKIYVKTGAGATAYAELATTAGSTLQASYESGNTISVTTAEGTIDFSNSTDATDVLTLSRTFAGAGEALSVSMGATTTGNAIEVTVTAGATGNALHIANSGDGNALLVKDGAADVILVNDLGKVEITPSSGQNAFISSGGGGNVELQVAGIGAMSITSAATTGTMGDTTIQTTAVNGGTIGGDVLIGAQLQSGGTPGGVSIHAGSTSITAPTSGQLLLTSTDGTNLVRGADTIVAIDSAGAIAVTPPAAQNASVTALTTGDINVTAAQGDISIGTSDATTSGNVEITAKTTTGTAGNIRVVSYPTGAGTSGGVAIAAGTLPTPGADSVTITANRAGLFGITANAGGSVGSTSSITTTSTAGGTAGHLKIYSVGTGGGTSGGVSIAGGAVAANPVAGQVLIESTNSVVVTRSGTTVIEADLQGNVDITPLSGFDFTADTAGIGNTNLSATGTGGARLQTNSGGVIVSAGSLALSHTAGLAQIQGTAGVNVTATNAGSAGSDVNVVAGNAGSATNPGGEIVITAGNGLTTGVGGDVTLTGGTSGTGKPGHLVAVTTRTATNTQAAADGPAFTIQQDTATARVFVGTAVPSSGSGVVAEEGSLYLYNVGGGGAVYIKTGAAATGWTVAATAGATSLQTAYVTGNSIAVTTAEGTLDFSNSADSTDVLTLSRTFAGGGEALSVSMGASTTGHGAEITMVAGSTGVGIAIPNAATSATSHGISVAMTGAMNAGASGIRSVVSNASAAGQGVYVTHAGSGEALDVTASGTGIAARFSSSGTGNALTVRDGTTDVLTIDQYGVITGLANNDGTVGSAISLTAGAGVTGIGGASSLVAGAGGSAGGGGAVNVTSGAASVATFHAGHVNITAGAQTSTGTGKGGNVQLTAGDKTNAGGTAAAGSIILNAGVDAGSGGGGGISLNSGNSDTGGGGFLSGTAGEGTTSGDGGDVTFTGGLSNAGIGGDAILVGGLSNGVSGGRAALEGGVGLTTASGGNCEIFAGDAPSGIGGGGSVLITAGDAAIGQGGIVTITGGASPIGTNGGNVTLVGGATPSGAQPGQIRLVTDRTSSNGAAATDGAVLQMTQDNGGTPQTASVFVGPDAPNLVSGVTAGEGSIYLKTTATAGEMYLKTGAAATAWTQVSTATSNTLQSAYDNGETIAVTGTDGPVEISTAIAAINALEVSSSGTGIALVVDATSTGNALEVRDSGTPVFTVTGAGAVSANPTSGQSFTAAVSGAGAVQLISTISNIEFTTTGGAISAFSQETTGTAGNIDLRSLVTGAGTSGHVVLGTRSTAGTSGGIVLAAGVAPPTPAAGEIRVDASAGVSIDAAAASNVSVTAANLTVSTITSGTLSVTSAGALTASGAAASSLTTSAGALTITGAAASTWSTAAGALTITSAAAATWSTTAGILTLNGTGGINLQGGATTALAINATGTIATFSADTSAQFVESSGDPTTAANQGAIYTKDVGGNTELFFRSDSSGAVTQLTPAGAVSASQVVQTGFTTTGLADGDLGYISSSQTVSLAIATSLAASFVIGANEGTAGSMTTHGTIENQNVESTITVTAGDRLFLSASEAGKVTNVAPSTVGQVVAPVGYARTSNGGAGNDVSMLIALMSPVLL